MIVVFIATPAGVVHYGPFTPAQRSPTSLTWAVPATLPLGNGFATVVIVNTDQGFIQSNPQSQLLHGAASANLPTILAVNGVACRPADPGVPLASIETALAPGSTATITGTGFNAALVNLFSPTAAHGPLVPLAGATATRLQVVIPAAVPTGPGALQLVNNPYAGNVMSNAVSVALGARLTITAVTQSGPVVTVTGTGFSPASVLNLFNRQGSGVVNIGGLGPAGPRIPLTVVSSTELRFTVPSGAQSGPAYVQVLNPPFIDFSSTGGDPDGAFMLSNPGA